MFRSEDEIYKATSGFYRNKGLDKHEFIKRLKLVRDLLSGDDTMSSAIDWIFATEYIMHHAGGSDDDVKDVKRGIREELKGLLSSLDIKASRNTLVDLRKE